MLSTRNRPFTTQPLDPSTRQHAKLYFKLIQVTHHKRIIDNAISSNTLPTGMMRQAQKLTDFVKPAAPTPHTRQQIHTHTTAWMAGTIDILQTHYETQLQTLIQQAPPFHDTAFNIATNWAKKRYTHKLSSLTLQSAHTHASSLPPPAHLHTTPQQTPQPNQHTIPTIPDLQDLTSFPPLSHTHPSNDTQTAAPTQTETVTQPTTPQHTPQPTLHLSPTHISDTHPDHDSFTSTQPQQTQATPSQHNTEAVSPTIPLIPPPTPGQVPILPALRRTSSSSPHPPPPLSTPHCILKPLATHLKSTHTQAEHSHPRRPNTHYWKKVCLSFHSHHTGTRRNFKGTFTFITADSNSFTISRIRTTIHPFHLHTPPPGSLPALR
ncbi:mucin-6-like [Engraulis encrasicolus]|uniref:mucin-6-like n=1 Tax=Engraulis encrasicolus TaxID=184585 RepID=UPI002FCEEE2D